MSTTVTYKGNTLATVSNNTKTLKTAGKYMEGDVTLTDTSSTISDFIITVAYNTTTQQWEPDCTWAELSAANTAGKTIIVNATDSNYSYEPTADIIGFLGNDNHFEYKVNWFDFNQSLGLDGWVIHDVYHLNSSGLTLYQRDSFDSPKTLISKSITVNGTYNAITTDSVDGYSSVTVNVPTGSTINNQNKTVTPTTSQQTITADSGYTGLGTVTINAMPTMTLPTSVSSSATSGYTSKATIGRSTAAQYINIPPGYNSAGAYYVISAVANGSATGPTSLSGSSATITTGTNTITLTKTGVMTTPTVSAGYVSSATSSTATVALTASVTVNPTPTASGATVTIPAGYYSSQTTKSVTSGSATAPSSISGTAASVSTGTNTLTLTKTVSVTPTVTAGYVSSGTAGNSSVSLTASVTTKAAATITPTTTNQTIAAGTYLTGVQTIAGDADLVGSNILSTANIFGVQGTVDFIDVYIRSTAPTSSVGSDGDIYIQE